VRLLAKLGLAGHRTAAMGAQEDGGSVQSPCPHPHEERACG